MTKDNINPSHYKQGKIECIDALEAATVNKKGLDAVCTANVIKYLWRCEEKGGVEDLKKAMWYLQKMIDNNSTEEEFVRKSSPSMVTSFTQDPLWSKL